MKLVIQRVKRAEVTVNHEVVGKINQGLMVLVGIHQEDTKQIANELIRKLIHLRIFEDRDGKMNLSLQDIGGELLLVSQFTLYADCKKGNRPSFTEAAKPDIAKELYEYMVEELSKKIATVKTGIFGANMQVSLVNDGPVTILLEKIKVAKSDSI